MNRKTVYLAGPMTGIEDLNFPAFNATAAKLRKAGFVVHNPAGSFDGDMTLDRAQYLKAAILLLVQCDGIALLPGWERSEGAIMEAIIAKNLGLFAIDAITMDNLGTGFSIDADCWTTVGLVSPILYLTRVIKDVSPLHTEGFTAEDVRQWWEGSGWATSYFKDIGPYISAALANAGCEHRNERVTANRATSKGRGLLLWYPPMRSARTA